MPVVLMFRKYMQPKAGELNNATSTMGTIITLRRNLNPLLRNLDHEYIERPSPQPCGNAQNARAQRGIKASENSGSVTIMGQEAPIIAAAQ